MTSVDYATRRRVEKALERAGFWYPPDLIDAVAEGRESYWSLGGPERGMQWRVTEAQRALIGRLLDPPPVPQVELRFLDRG